MSEIDISEKAVERHLHDVGSSYENWYERNAQMMHSLRAALTAKEAELAEMQLERDANKNAHDAWQRDCLDTKAKLREVQSQLSTARNAALEEAARVCDTANKLPQHPEARGNSLAYLAGMIVCAEAIRALMTTPTPDRQARELAEAIKAARARYDAMTPEQKAAHDKAQKESFVRGMMPTGDPRFD